jgi:hypothetical protein
MSSSEAAEADIDLAERKDPHTNMAVSKNVAEIMAAQTGCVCVLLAVLLSMRNSSWQALV